MKNITILNSCLLAFLLLASMNYVAPELNSVKLVYAQPCDDNCPDAFGNQVSNLTVYAWNTTHFNQQDETWTWLNYSCPTGFDITVNASELLRFNVTVWLNKDNATTAADAITKTRVYITIETGSWGGVAEGGWNHRLMNDGVDAASFDATYWAVNYYEDWLGGATAGTVYYVTIEYEAWY